MRAIPTTVGTSAHQGVPLLSTSKDSSDWLTPGERLRRRMIYVYKCECGRAFTHVIVEEAGS
jgi:hypothetical protein